MYLQDYIWYIGAALLCALFSGFASNKVRTSFERFNRIPCRSGMSGAEAVRQLFQSNGVYDIAIGHVSGELTDHYHPTKSIINLSDSTYHSNSVAAVAVAAHEVGHVMQRRSGNLFYRLRTLLVPVVNFGSRLAIPLVLLGLVMELYIATADPEMGFRVAMFGVILYGASFLFALVTLPVELDASNRAKQLLINNNIISADEFQGASEVLSAAALTYLASMLTSLVSFLRFLVWVLSIFGRRDRR